MTPLQKLWKRSFDFLMAIFALALLWPVIAVCWAIAAIDTRNTGFFWQERVGSNGKVFKMFKIRTMRSNTGTTITSANDARITKWGRRFRNTKLDELPQLWNVIIGDMSFVGPRPDVPGYMDQVGLDWDSVRRLKPGITGPASLHFRNEETLLASVSDVVAYNDQVIWPKKLEINKEYAENWSFWKDIKYIFDTIFK